MGPSQDPFSLLTRKSRLPNLSPLPPAICLKEMAPQFFTGSHRPLLLQQPPAAAGAGPLLVQASFQAEPRDTLFLASPSAAQPRSTCGLCLSFL
jgi:hypothetical protein